MIHIDNWINFMETNNIIPPEVVRKENNMFYMVYVENKNFPNKCHPSEESAINEAKRLCKKHPESEVFVLKTVFKIETADVPLKITPIL